MMSANTPEAWQLLVLSSLLEFSLAQQPLSPVVQPGEYMQNRYCGQET